MSDLLDAIGGSDKAGFHPKVALITEAGLLEVWRAHRAEATDPRAKSDRVREAAEHHGLQPRRTRQNAARTVRSSGGWWENDWEDLHL